MQLLRQERHPLVALAGTAFVLRLCLLVLASALSPQMAAADGLTSLCQPSGLEQGLPAPHDPIHCQCAQACPHGCAMGPCLAPQAQATGPSRAVQESVEATRQGPSALRYPEKTRAIRGPPVSRI
ncbi:hypothetical protein [Labrenzia sp. VG12]|uniref:hypothetical protein n=1 Tax=Labrenzia sp. VG12 TaxID=2021862 RepID=UPI0012FE3999|nr:hypothetical protein [Labrenzia sp. VG12]